MAILALKLIGYWNPSNDTKWLDSNQSKKPFTKVSETTDFQIDIEWWLNQKPI